MVNELDHASDQPERNFLDSPIYGPGRVPDVLRVSQVAQQSVIS